MESSPPWPPGRPNSIPGSWMPPPEKGDLLGHELAFRGLVHSPACFTLATFLAGASRFIQSKTASSVQIHFESNQTMTGKPPFEPHSHPVFFLKCRTHPLFPKQSDSQDQTQFETQTRKGDVSLIVD